MADYPFIQAKNCGPERSGQRIDLIVVHTMEAPEKPGTARAVAHWFAGSDAPKASAHYCVDDREIILCVPESVVAWACGQHEINVDSISLEHAGYAAQSGAQWDDEYSRAVLAQSAKVAADICLRHGIPLVRVTSAQLKAGGARGLCGHVDITNGLLGGKGHQDPGGAFPWDHYLDLVRAALPTPDDVALDDETRARVMAIVAQSLRDNESDEFARRLDGDDALKQG